MKISIRITTVIVLLAIGLSLAGCGQAPQGTASPETTTAATSCDEHSLSDCPTCSPELIESMGFCTGHGVPEAICSQCRGDLEGFFRSQNDWCNGHGLPESQCEACNPGVLDKWEHMAGKVTTYDVVELCLGHEVQDCPFCQPSLMEEMGFCTGHGVPEAVCTKCRDDLEGAFRSEGDWCGGHGLPESHCEACNPGTLDRYQSSLLTPLPKPQEPEMAVVPLDTPRIQSLPSLSCATESSLIRFANAQVSERVGVRLEEVQTDTLRKFIEAPATIDYDARTHARLAPRAAGTVVEVLRDLGDTVEAGDVLIVLEAPALGAAKSELLQAAAHVGLWEQNSQRERALLEKGLSTKRETLDAETQLVESQIALASASQRLANLGLTPEQVSAVQEQGETSPLLNITAPFAGVVVGLETVLGESASPLQPIISVADTSQMWVFVDVDQEKIRLVEKGQPVLLTVNSWAGETMGGRVTWISSEVDPQTRTVKVRAEFANPAGMLRAKSFCTARIVSRDESLAVLVPKDAVQWEGCCNVAFVRNSPTEFAPRKLRLGYDTGDYYEVLSGMSGGEAVVTQGSFLLKTELRKGSIGAGCCEVDYLAE